MTPRKGEAPQSAPGLDNLTLARKEGWQQFVDTPARIPPEPLTRNQIEALEKVVRSQTCLRRNWVDADRSGSVSPGGRLRRRPRGDPDAPRRRLVGSLTSP